MENGVKENRVEVSTGHGGNDSRQGDRDRELAGRYVPHLRYDRREPFSLAGIGYTVNRSRAKSPSCRRFLEPPKSGAVIEYAFYYDFDIQHLYDLEHSFVYLDQEGRIVGVESSFHGKFLNSLIRDVLEIEDTHPVLYVQPGKHAFFPSPEYFQLVIDRDRACREEAGKDGFLIAPMFEGRLITDQGKDRKVEAYIREHFSFTPCWEFTERSPDGKTAEELLMPYGELDAMIVRRLSSLIERISAWNPERNTPG
ncbi:MAG: hypothetical protein K2G28_12875 [Acetatifactor sp.]|nr:hypothetical protein [Acetatifactor sp.]MDE7353271.1 hypothetical protein [Acetatifactor sp.]